MGAIDLAGDGARLRGDGGLGMYCGVPVVGTRHRRYLVETIRVPVTVK